MSNDLVLLADLERGGALTPRGLTLPTTITYDRYEALGAHLGHATEVLQFAIGDWLVAGESLFPEQWSQAAEALSLSESERGRYARVASRVPPEIRKQELSWSHHRAVAGLERGEQEHWLNLAVNERLSKAQLEELIAEHKRKSQAGRVPAPPRSYVVERVADMATRVWESALRVDDGWLVPEAQMVELASALGVELP